MRITGKAVGHVLFNGTIELEYHADVEADYTYDPGCYRTSNGDGWPPSESYDDLEFEVTEVHAYLDDKEIEVTEEMWDACDKDADNLKEEDVDWDEPEPEWDYDEPEEWDDE